ncbi:MAG: VCBS repeat-containing protein [Deltaproteobacteria bacterium]|nr:VCBS repeat-containing protein [Deltaproteobacteria bacterium]
MKPNGYGGGNAYTFKLGFARLMADRLAVEAGTLTREAYEAEFRVMSVPGTGRDYYCGRNQALGDVDGDGQLDVVVPGTQHIYVYSGQTGELKPYSQGDTDPGAAPCIGSIPYGGAALRLADVDGDGRDEILAFIHTTGYASLSSHRVLLLEVEGAIAGEGTMRVRWQRALPDRLSDAASFVGTSVFQLAGNGGHVVAASLYDHTLPEGGTGWTTMLLDAAGNGACPSTCLSATCQSACSFNELTDCPPAVLATLSDEKVLGTADLDGDGVVELLTQKLSNSGVRAYRLAWATPPALLWELPSTSLLSANDPSGLAGQSLSGLPLLIDAGPVPDGIPELLVSRSGALQALRAGGAMPVSVLQHPLFVNAGVSSVHPAVGVVPTAGPGVQLLVNRTDGFVEVLASDFTLANDGDRDGMPELRSGGYQTDWLLAADLDANPTAPQINLLVVDNRGYLLRLNPSPAVSDLLHPPRVDWAISNPGMGSLSLVDLDADGAPEMATVRSAAIGLELRGLGGDGTTVRWSAPLAASSTRAGSYHDPLPCDYDGNGALDLFYDYLLPIADRSAYGVLRGTDLTKGWQEYQALSYQGDGQGYRAVYPVATGDRYVITPYRTARLLGGVGSPPAAQELARVEGVATYAAMPTVFDLDGDGALEILLSGGSSGTKRGPEAYEVGAGQSSLALKWTSTDLPGEDYQRYAAVASTAAGVRAFACRADQPHCYLQDGASGAILADLQPAGGQIFLAPQTPPADLPPGYGGSPLAISDLAGDGKAAFVFGTSDGWLFAIDASTGAKIWALELRYPVGSPIAADLDNDGKVELVVSVADGYLYGIDQGALPAPAAIYDTDGTFLGTSDLGPGRCAALAPEDLDCTERADVLAANWEPVAGAEGYEIAFVSQNGTYVQYWTDVGLVTSAAATGLHLSFRFTYRAVVRAYAIQHGSKVVSPERTSDGVQIVDLTAPTLTLADAPDPLTDANLTSTIVLRAEDRTGLTGWMLKLTSPDGTRLELSASDHGLNAARLERTLTWSAESGGVRADPGVHRLEATVVDVGGHTATASGEITVCGRFFKADEQGECRCPDRDGDGHPDSRCQGDDCEDSDFAVHPGASEDCGSGKDLDCDGKSTRCRTQDGYVCVAHECALPCEGGEIQSCAEAGKVCVDGYCLTDPCFNACPEGVECQGGICLYADAGVPPDAAAEQADASLPQDSGAAVIADASTAHLPTAERDQSATLSCGCSAVDTPLAGYELLLLGALVLVRRRGRAG